MVNEFHQTTHPLVFLYRKITKLAVSQSNLSDDLTEDHETASKRPVCNHYTIHAKGLIKSNYFNVNIAKLAELQLKPSDDLNEDHETASERLIIIKV